MTGRGQRAGEGNLSVRLAKSEGTGRECLEEAIMQSFFDGELSPSMMGSVTKHIVSCLPCAEAAREVEKEMAMLAAAFNYEMPLSVPTVLLRERLYAAMPNYSRGWWGATASPVARVKRHKGASSERA